MKSTEQTLKKVDKLRKERDRCQQRLSLAHVSVVEWTDRVNVLNVEIRYLTGAD